MKEYNISELTNSRMLYDKNPPKFIYAIIFITLLLLGGTIVAAFFIHKPYVVKASGIVISEQKTTIMTKLQCTIVSVYLKEGQIVNQGDVLITLDSGQTTIQMQQLTDMANYYQKLIDNYHKCITQLENGINTFSSYNFDEALFYNAIELCKSKMAQYNISDAHYKAAGYTDEQIMELQAQNKSQMNAVKLQTISDLQIQCSSVEVNLQDIVTKLNQHEKILEDYTIKAPQSGIVHLNGDIQPSMTLQPGTALGTISAQDQSTLVIEVYVPAQDKSKIKLNSPVQITISGVLQNDYGVLYGIVQSIDADATVNQEKNTVFYKAIIKPNTTVLKNKSGNEIIISNGMMAQVNIQYDDTTWFNWALDQIGIK